jgi:cyclohexyl-isocyanide hydratase
MNATEQVSSLSIGMVLFPNLTQLDFTGPYEVFARLPNTRVYLLAETLEPVRSDRGLAFLPDTTFEHIEHAFLVHALAWAGSSASPS